MYYWILWFLLAIWVLFDAKKRKNNFIGWSISTFAVGPLLLPIYLAKRNLKSGDTREGGTAWNVLKNFALFWTLTMAVAGIAGLVSVGGSVNNGASDAQKAGTAIGAGIGLTMLFIIWFIVAVSALIIGFFLKKSSLVEKGPTGKLNESFENTHKGISI